MRKPSAYFPFYGNDFFEAIAGYPDAVGMGYLRALWHYWHHTACEGLPDDDEYLRRVCCVDSPQWPATRRIIFDNRYHFKLEGGLWHQPRCRSEWDISLNLYEKKLKQTAAATAARLKSRRNVARNDQRNVASHEERYVHQSPSPSPSSSV
jgi:uncharacterized protein YdaU (DUF1376 family)